jgi:vanillate O-demethylase ferredoxin subunit
METVAVKVTKKIREAEDILSFELASVDGSPLPPFSAGSHIDVHIKEKVIRQYSLCNDPAETHRYLIGVLRDPQSRGGSVAMHDNLALGDLLKISVPKNHFALVPAEKTLLFAGGIGVTPILCMAERLAQIKADFEMHYCTRSTEKTAFIDRIKAAPFASKVHFHFDNGPSEQTLSIDEALGLPHNGKHMYVCGPSGFIDYVVGAAEKLGWVSDHIHFEYFGAKPTETVAGDERFEVMIASTGNCYTVPVDRTVVQVLGEHGIDIPVSCEQGVCGTCITRVLNGVPDHRDVYFTDEERARNDQFTPCCSRSKSSRLVLDI